MRKKTKQSINYRWLIICLLLIAGVAVTVLGKSPQKPNSLACGPYRQDAVVTVNREKLQAEVAKSSAAYTKGLGGRPCILPEQAMLFEFDHPGQYAMWMKDMRFPIDIVWLSPDKKVVGYYLEVAPSTYPDKFVNEKSLPARYVLELKAGSVKQLHIVQGTTVGF